MEQYHQAHSNSAAFIRAGALCDPASITIHVKQQTENSDKLHVI